MNFINTIVWLQNFHGSGCGVEIPVWIQTSTCWLLQAGATRRQPRNTKMEQLYCPLEQDGMLPLTGENVYYILHFFLYSDILIQLVHLSMD